MLNRLQDNFKIQILLVALLCFVAYGNTFKHSFVLDDQSAIVSNSFVKKGLSGIPDIWTHSYMYGYSKQNDETYRPIPTTLFAVCYQVFGENATPYHVIQVVLYMLLCILVLFYLKRLLRDFQPLYPLLITLIFCVHPIHTEVVANIKSADEILSLLFGIAALHIFLFAIDKVKGKFILLAVVAYFLAITSKETAVTLIVLFPLQLWFFRDVSVKKILSFSSAFVVPLFLYFILRSNLLDSMTFDENSSKLSVYNNSLLAATNFPETVGTAFSVLGYYLKLIFVPSNLTYDYSLNVFPIENLSNLKPLASIFIYIGLGVLAIFGVLKKWGFAFGLILFLAVLSIYSNLIVKIASSGGERFLFSPLLGFILFAVLAVDFIQDRKTLTWLKKGVVSILSLLLIVVFTSMTIQRNSDWKNDETLFLHDVEVVPESFRANIFAASIYQEKAESTSNLNAKTSLYQKAIKHLKTSYTIFPEYDENYIQLAQCYRNIGDWNKMKTVINAGFKYRENDLLLVSLLAEAHLNSNEFPKSRANFLILEKSGDSTYTYSSKFNMGATYLNEQKFDSALVWFGKSLTISPKDIPSTYYSAMCYFQVGSLEKAIESFSKVPNNHETYAHSQSSIGTIYLIQENYEMALVHLKLALLVVPGDENILNNMIVAYQGLGQLDKAEECAQMINSPNAAPGLQ